MGIVVQDEEVDSGNGQQKRFVFHLVQSKCLLMVCFLAGIDLHTGEKQHLISCISSGGRST